MTNDKIMTETKAAKKRRVASIIDKYKDGQIFKKSDCQEVSHLCGYQFEQITKIKKRMISVVCPSENYTGTWSWNKSIDGYSENKNLLQAMRTASRKGSYSKHELIVCEDCGSKSDLTVDHKTTPFSEIAQLYKMANLCMDVVNVDGYGWCLKNEREFTRFHDNIADYQTLCRSCNAAKSNKKAPLPITGRK